jgi:hypothetical protein
MEQDKGGGLKIKLRLGGNILKREEREPMLDNLKVLLLPRPVPHYKLKTHSIESLSLHAIRQKRLGHQQRQARLSLKSVP